MSASVAILERTLLYVIVTLTPREARSKAMAWPIPRDAPVTMALSVCQSVDLKSMGSGNYNLPSSVRGCLVGAMGRWIFPDVPSFLPW